MNAGFFGAIAIVLEPCCIAYTWAHLGAGLVEQLPRPRCLYEYPEIWGCSGSSPMIQC